MKRKLFSSPCAVVGSVGLAACVLASGCGPIAFTDDTSIVVTGNPPAPPPPKRVVVKVKRVIVTEDAIEITEKIQFAYNESEILGASFGLLDEIKSVLIEHPEIKTISIEGHTDTDGSDSYNQNLSDRRAASVMTYLVENGIEESRMSSVGFGESKPLVDEKSDADKETNRRVEFRITEQDQRKVEYEVDPESGERREVKAGK